MGEKIAKWLYYKLPDQIIHNDNVRQNIQTLNPAGNIPKSQKEYVLKKLSLCMCVLIAGVLVSVLMWIKNANDTNIVDNTLMRNDYGNGSKTVSVVATGEGVDYDINVELGAREYSEEELSELSEEAVTVLETAILGQNESFDRIEYDMRFVKSIEGYPFTVEYDTDEEYIDYQGKLVKDVLNEPKMVEITAALKCGLFTIEHVFNVRVFTKAIQPGIRELLQKQLNKNESDNRKSLEFKLPDTIGEIKLDWSYKRSYTGLLFLAATPILMIVIYFSKDRDLSRKVEDREEQMLGDYPEIVSSLALLIGAGMTVPNAWNKIARDYKTRKEETGISRYAYEEMLFTIYEMDSGIMHTAAYERFGRRCRIPCYNKISTMLSQNIRKGAANLPLLLKNEAKEAFEERKHMARKQGEKAGTKLLVPMMLLLGITMVIIMVPAINIYF
jgi:hypothetical protein